MHVVYPVRCVDLDHVFEGREGTADLYRLLAGLYFLSISTLKVFCSWINGKLAQQQISVVQRSL